EPERGANGRIQLAHRSLSEPLDRMVERAHALHGADREPLRERAVAPLEPGRGRPQDAIRVRIVLEDAQDDLVRRLARCQRWPRTTPSSVWRGLPAGSTSRCSSRPPAPRALQTVTPRPWSCARAPMWGERARILFPSSSGESFQSSSRSAAVILAAYVAPWSS